jgi:hypothetical protein
MLWKFMQTTSVVISRVLIRMVRKGTSFHNAMKIHADDICSYYQGFVLDGTQGNQFS